jgi:hypothetical protein
MAPRSPAKASPGNGEWAAWIMVRPVPDSLEVLQVVECGYLRVGDVADGPRHHLYLLPAEDYVRFVRGLRRYTIVLLVSAVCVPFMASSAMADLHDHDPDDTPTSFDLRAVRSIALPGRHLLFRSTFYDVLEWRGTSHVWVYLDSRTGPSYDFLLAASVRHGDARCSLYSRDSLVGPVGVRVGPRRAACNVARRFLKLTHAIRWKVRAISRDASDLVSDWAPGGFGNWYPHV